jgi:tetratricopeptide (TPR) repeat protein
LETNRLPIIATDSGRFACGKFLLMPDPSRLEMLTQFLEQNPSDAFARYGLAMEYSNAGQTEQALAEFKKLLEMHPDYTNGYFMAAQALERSGRTPEAKQMLESGVEAARRTGNKHALSEMTGMLEEISS